MTREHCSETSLHVCRGGVTTNSDEIEAVSVTETVGDSVNVEIKSKSDVARLKKLHHVL